MKNIRYRKLYNRNKNRIFILCFMFCFLSVGFSLHHLSNAIYNFEKEPNNNYESFNQIGYTGGNEEPEETIAYYKKNVSQFDIHESVTYLANQRVIDIENENLAFDIPESWTGRYTAGGVFDVFLKEEILKHNNGDFNDIGSNWFTDTMYPYPPLYPNDPYVNFSWDTYDTDNGYMRMKFNNSHPYTPSDFWGEIINENNTYGHGGVPVEVGEKFTGTESEIALYDDFIDDPGYQTILDPYGNQRRNSDVDAYHNPSIDSMVTELDLWDGIFNRGDPSVALQTIFYIPFEADSITITFAWAVDNVGYEHDDGFQVKSRVNGQYIDGSESAWGELYTEGDNESLENDDTWGSEQSHDVWERTYNITELVGSYGQRTGWHRLDFGCWMSDPTFEGFYTPDDVFVNWDYIEINATHYDWYKAAEIDFEYVMNDLDESGDSGNDDMALVLYFGDASAGQMGRYVVNLTSDLKFGDWESDRVNVTVKIPHKFKDYFSKDSFMFRIGLECVNPFTSYVYGAGGGGADNRWVYEFAVDNIEINVNYILGSGESTGLQYRIAGSGDPWKDYIDDEMIGEDIDESYPGFEMEFQVTNPLIPSSAKPYMRIFAAMYMEKISEQAALASVSIESFDRANALWNITYNNTESVNQFDNVSLTNNDFYEYNITMANLPAFDGKGAQSEDWNIYSVFSPNNLNVSEIAVLWSEDPFYQNGTVVNATSGRPGSLVRGIWKVYATQSNYMVEGSFNHINGDPSEKFYHNDDANYTLEVQNFTGLSGNYKVIIENASSDTISGFPKYHNGVENHTETWTVEDNGVGVYEIYSLFNDTDGNNQTKRVGWAKDVFKVWRYTEVNVEVTEIPVLYGESIEYTVEFNSTEFGGIDGATILAYHNKTGSLWGRDWTSQYLLDYYNPLDDGQYKIGLKTDGVPFENYSIHFECYKAFHDFKYSPTEWLNMTIVESLKNITVTYLSGAYNYSNSEGFLTKNNIPIVNDSSNFIIQFQLNESKNGGKIQQAYVTASFNTSDNFMVAIEEYVITHLDSDKGIYNLTLDCEGLSETTYSGNITLLLSFSASGFNPYYQNISVQINPIPLVIEHQPIIDIYEGSSISIVSSLYLDTIDGLIGCDYGTMKWALYNSSDDMILNGSLVRSIGNSYIAEITIDQSNYLDPGDYYVILNATGQNLNYTETNHIDFAVYEKYVSQMSLIFPEKVRIGIFLTIAAKLTYVNSTPISGKDISLTVNYSETYTYQTVVQSDSVGRGVYELSIPEKYKGENLTVTAAFSGSGLIKSCSFTKTQKILGKIGVNITFTEAPENVQVGYNVTYGMNLSIEGEENYEGTLVYLFGFYDYYPGTSTQPFLVRELSTDGNGTASYTIDSIADGYENITVFFEYLGDIETEHQINSTTSQIINKWNTTIAFEVDGVKNGVPSGIRIRQTIEINITLIPLESTFSESYAGMPIQLIFNYTQSIGGYTYNTNDYYTDANGSLRIEYTILDQDLSALNISVKFSSTSKISGANTVISTPLLPKKSSILNLDSSSQGELIQGVYYYSVNLTDGDGLPLANFEIIFYVFNELGQQVSDPYVGVTNTEGFVSVSIDMTEFEPGEYSITAKFGGSGIYAQGNSGEVTVQITTPFLIFLDYLPYIALAIGIIISSIFIVYRAVIIPRRVRRMEALQAIHQRFEDAENIQYVLIVSRESGLNIFARSFTNLPIDADLISGFLTAISSFGAEIGGKMEKKASSDKGLEQLSYKQFKIIVNDVALVRTAILLLNDASLTLKENLRKFNLRFQETFLDRLDNWNGAPLPDGPIMELIEKHLDVDLLYPHNLNPSRIEPYLKTVDKKSIQKHLIEEAQKPKFNGTFRIRAMLNHMLVMGEEEVLIFNGIDTLRKERVLYAVNPRTKYLIDKFKPIIELLSEDAKKVLNAIANGIDTETRLRKVKGVENFNEAITILIDMGLIDQLYRLTDTGDAIITLMKLMPTI